MKIRFTLLFSLIALPCFAEPNCEFLKVTVKNDTPNTCYLIQRDIYSGAIYAREPYKIKAGAQITQFELIEKKMQPINMVMTYECGEDHTVTFSVYKGACYYSHTGKVEGMIVKTNNLNAVFYRTESNYFTQTPATIFWTLS